MARSIPIDQSSTLIQLTIEDLARIAGIDESVPWLSVDYCYDRRDGELVEITISAPGLGVNAPDTVTEVKNIIIA